MYRGNNNFKGNRVIHQPGQTNLKLTPAIIQEYNVRGFHKGMRNLTSPVPILCLYCVYDFKDNDAPWQRPIISKFCLITAIDVVCCCKCPPGGQFGIQTVAMHAIVQVSHSVHFPGIIQGMGSPNERRCYIMISSLIGWAHTQNNHCFLSARSGYSRADLWMTPIVLGKIAI